MSKNINNIRKISNIPSSCRERYLPLTGQDAEVLIAAGINFSGISNLRRGYQIGYPDLAFRHMVIFTKSGEGYLRTRDQNYQLTENTVTSVPPGNPCMFGVKDDQWDILWFYMLDIPYWKSLKERGIDCRKTIFIPKLELAMEGYLSETQNKEPGNKAAGLFAELTSFYLEQSFGINQQKIFDETKNKLEKIWGRVQETPDESWDKKTMARELHVSTSTFDRLVKKYYDTTPWQKVIQIRMEQAKMLLIKTDYPLQVIAERLGYANEFIFSNAFKQYTAISPKYFRQKKTPSEAMSPEGVI